jgi:hypothetical protein
LLPNSLHAKHGISPFAKFFRGALAYVTGVTFSERLGFPARPSFVGRTVVVLLSALALVNPEIRRRFTHSYALLLYPWLLVVAYSAIGSFPGHNWEFYSARFFLQVAAGIGLLTLGTWLGKRLRVPRSLRLSTAALVLLFAPVNGGLRSASMASDFARKDTSYWGGARYETYRRIADWVTQHLPRGTTIAISEAGTLAYFSDVKVIDVSGIVTRGYEPEERMDHVRFMARFSPKYALLYGDVAEVWIDQVPRYRRVAHFDKRGFEEFSLVAAMR